MTKRPRFSSQTAHDDIRFTIGSCALGAILVAINQRGVCAIALGDDAEILRCDYQKRLPNAKYRPGDDECEQRLAEVVGFIDSPRQALKPDFPLDLQGTTFQQRVWQALLEIPFGTTASYTQIAQRINAPKSARAVAGACAANPLAIIIPCHRVIHRDGSLSGYHWGIERKTQLLQRERDDLFKVEA